MIYIFLCLGMIILICSIVFGTELKFMHKKYSKIKNKNGVDAKSLARDVLDSLNLKDVEVIFKEKGRSFFNFKNNVINLKSLNFNRSSIRDIAVVLNLVGQAVLFKEKKVWFKLIRVFLFTTRIFLYLFLFVAIFKFISFYIYLFGIILLLLSVFLELIASFSQFNVSSKVVLIVSSRNMLDFEDIFLVKKVLKNICFSNFANILDDAFLLI